LLSGLNRKLLNPGAYLKEGKGLPRSYNPINVKKELIGEWGI
jgi:hypothetical protein